jgi:hypothetical protein
MAKKPKQHNPNKKSVSPQPKLWVVHKNNSEIHIVMAATKAEALRKGARYSYEFPPYHPDQFVAFEIKYASSMSWWDDDNGKWMVVPKDRNEADACDWESPATDAPGSLFAEPLLPRVKEGK